jgi:hypothetical protein
MSDTQTQNELKHEPCLTLWLQNINLEKNPWQWQLPWKHNLYTWRWPIRSKYLVYVYNKENKKSEHQPKLHVDGKSDTKSKIYTVQQDAEILLLLFVRVWVLIGSRILTSPYCPDWLWAHTTTSPLGTGASFPLGGGGGFKWQEREADH